VGFELSTPSDLRGARLALGGLGFEREKTAHGRNAGDDIGAARAEPAAHGATGSTRRDLGIAESDDPGLKGEGFERRDDEIRFAQGSPSTSSWHRHHSPGPVYRRQWRQNQQKIAARSSVVKAFKSCKATATARGSLRRVSIGFGRSVMLAPWG
jgi:hypothetical protein